MMKKNILKGWKVNSKTYFTKRLMMNVIERINAKTRDVQKIGPQLGISPISGHFWPKIGLGLGWGLQIFKNCGQGWGWGCKIKENCG